MRHATLIIIATVILCTTPTCKRDTTSDTSTGHRSPSTSKSTVFEYPKGRWRLATFDELDRTTLWLGHIAIRHDRSSPATFREGLWRPDPANPTRSVDDALALAEEVAARAAADPDAFENLARRYSDDIVSRDAGGMLGGVRASQLTGSGFLDVLAVLKPGEVSKPFRTPYGVHILKRYPPPPEEKVSGERIVIGYEGVFALAKESSRSRDQALQLAEKVADLAKNGDQDFRTLIDRYSENVDRDQEDLGVYSTRDPGYLSTEILRLSQLEVGEVTGPVDSRFGFEILRRVPVRPRPEYAMAAIALPFDQRPSEQEASKARTLKKAEEIRRELQDKPERFEEFQRIYDSEGARRWADGRGEPGLSEVLDTIAVGKIAPKPLLHFGAYLLVKRLDPSTLPPEKPRLFELPNPSHPNYEALMKYNNGKKIAGAARSFLEEVRASDAFTPAVASNLAEMLGDLATRLERQPDDPTAVRDAVYTTLAKIENTLSAEQFEQFKAFGGKWASRQIMPAGSVE